MIKQLPVVAAAACLWSFAAAFDLWRHHACTFPGLEDGSLSRADVWAGYLPGVQDAQTCSRLCDGSGRHYGDNGESGSSLAEMVTCASFMHRKTSGECWLYRLRCTPVPNAEFDSGRDAAGDLTEVQKPFYKGGNRILLQDGDRRITVDDVAFGYELLANQEGLGAKMFGVRASQDPISLAQLQEQLWEVQPDLVVEIGTECGGLASIMAELQSLRGIEGQVLTVDIAPQGYAPWAHQDCEQRRADSTLWRKHTAGGRLRPVLRETRRWGCPCRFKGEGVAMEAESPTTCACAANDDELKRLVAAFASRAQRVLIIDDSSHFKEDVVNNFELLAPFVTSGSFYIVADSRLDRLCETMKRLSYPLANGFNPGEQVKCDFYIDNGPAAGIAAILRHSALAQMRFQVDRESEYMTLGSNPSGWLRAK